MLSIHQSANCEGIGDFDVLPEKSSGKVSKISSAGLIKTLRDDYPANYDISY
jgi:hypothetical protein